MGSGRSECGFERVLWWMSLDLDPGCVFESQEGTGLRLDCNRLKTQ
jgi:hypothetical protein